MPYPATGGAKIRMFYTARELAREHEVELLVVDEQPIDESAIEALESIFESVQVFSFPSRRFKLNAVRGVFSRKPLQTHYFQFSEVTEWLDEAVERFDLLYCNHVRTTEYARPYDVPVVVDLVDAISRNYKRADETATGLWRFIYPLEWRRLVRYEQAIAAGVDYAAVTTDADREFITNGGAESRLAILPNGVKPELLASEVGEYRSDPPNPRLVFLGKMDYHPNEDAAEHFARDVFPGVREEFPAAEFLVVGTNPSPRVQELGTLPGVTVTGFVEDPKQYLSDADIVVAPMRHGAGLQNKVLESMALGRPTVVTPLASEGIDIVDGEHVVVAKAGEDFAEAVTRLLSDSERRRSLGTKSRALVSSKYTWERIGSKLRTRVSEVLNASNPASGDG